MTFLMNLTIPNLKENQSETGIATSLVSSPEYFSLMWSLISCMAFLVTVSRHHSLILQEKGCRRQR